MAHDADNHDGDKHQEGNQKYRCRERIAVRRSWREHERLRIDRWGSDVHHHQKRTNCEKSNKYLFQLSLNDHLLTMEVFHNHPRFLTSGPSIDSDEQDVSVRWFQTGRASGTGSLFVL